MKALILMGSGLGNIIQATPTISAVKSLGYSVDVSIWSSMKDAHKVIEGWNLIDNIYFKHFPNLKDLIKFHKNRKWNFLLFNNDYYFEIEKYTNMSQYDKIVPTAHCAIHLYKKIRHDKRLIKHKFSLPSSKSDVLINLEVTEKLRYSFRNPPLTYCSYDENFKVSSYDYTFAMGCNPDPKWNRKKWPHFKKLAELLNPKNIAVVGIEGEGIDKTWSSNVTDYTGRLNIRQTATLIKNCKKIICNDNGIAHMAGALETKTFVLFGGTDLNKNKPMGNVQIISKNLECQPCQFSGNWNKCFNWRCMNELSAEEVYNKIK